MSGPANNLPHERMVANVAHALSQPIGSLIEEVRAAAQSLDLMLGALQRSTEHIVNHCHNLAWLATLLQGEALAPPKLLACNVRKALAIERFAPDLRVLVAPDLEVLAAPGALEMVLANLLRNSRIYASGAEITLTGGGVDAATAPLPAGVCSSLTGPAVLVTLADQGPGVSHEVLPHLFTLSTKTGGHGLGVGLWLCRTLVRAHGGDLWLDETPRGASFTSIWPAAPISWPSDARLFGLRVRALRQELHLTAKALAILANVSEVTVLTVERGKHPPSHRTRTQLINALSRCLKDRKTPPKE